MPSLLQVFTLAYSGESAVLMTFSTSRFEARFGADSRSYVALSMEAYNRGLTCFSSEEYLLKGQICFVHVRADYVSVHISIAILMRPPPWGPTRGPLNASARDTSATERAPGETVRATSAGT